jgi:hypothetical protein
VIDAAPPIRKYEIMSGRVKAARNASASMPRPKTQAMYKFRTSPKTLDKNVDAISTTVALKTECAWEGRSRATARAHSDGGSGGRPASVVGVLVTVVILSRFRMGRG